MFEALLLASYLIFVIAVGLGVVVRVKGWLADIDRVLPTVGRGTAVVYGFMAIILAMVLEFIIVLGFGGSSLRLMVALAVGVGPIEEGVKVLPFFLVGGERLVRWRITMNVALTFAIVEGSLYGALLLFNGDLIGALFRVVVIMFHVVWTAVALEGALNGSLPVGYLKASVLHSLYDAPVLLALAGADLVVLIPITLVSGVAVLLTYRGINGAFGAAYSLGRAMI